MLDDEPNPYSVLQVDPGADQEVLRAAYRVLARRFHPDVAEPAEAHRRMVSLNRAWELVSDPIRRRTTDRALAQRCPRPAASSNGGVDQSWRASSSVGGTTYQTPRWREHRVGTRPVNTWAAGAAGAPPGRPAGSVLDFGVFKGWSLGEVNRVDPGYLDWLVDRPEAGPYTAEIKGLRPRPGGSGAPLGRPARRRFFGFG